MSKLSDNARIGERYAEKLKACGVTSQRQLLRRGSRPAGRRKLSEETGISDELIIRWINRADLARVKAIGSECADLLECIGIDTISSLATRNPEILHQKMVETNERKHLVHSLPSPSSVSCWIDQARFLGRAIYY